MYGYMYYKKGEFILLTAIISKLDMTINHQFLRSVMIIVA